MPPKETEVPDEALELKKRARRRLVGAAALVLLAAIVLPMMMDQEQHPTVQDIQVRIPSQETEGFPARIPPAKPNAAETPAVKSDSGAKDQSSAKAETKPETKPEAKAKLAKPSTRTTEPVKPAQGTAAKPIAPAAQSEEARALAALSGAEVADQWEVQLGAYRDAANVKNLVTKIKQMHLPAFTEPFESPQGPRTRVRAGPFQSREAAERARDRISKIGVDGRVAKQ